MMTIVEEPPACLLKQLEASILSLPIVSSPSRVEIVDQAVEAADRDNLFQGDQHGRLPLQVLGDVGVLDLAKCHHLQSHLLVQYDVVGQDHFAEGPLAKGGWGQLVVAD